MIDGQYDEKVLRTKEEIMTQLSVIGFESRQRLRICSCFCSTTVNYREPPTFPVIISRLSSVYLKGVLSAANSMNDYWT